MRILFIGDVFGQPGRQAIKKWLPAYRDQAQVDFVIANGENSAGGKGITEGIANELWGLGIDVLTGGNHSFKHRESYSLFDRSSKLLRPANLPPGGGPGRGVGVYTATTGHRIAVVNLMGRAFMRPIDCPYRIADQILEEIEGQARIIFVDFHAEATSEKVAMAHYLDGRVTAVVGTHTHIPTSDSRVSTRGTAAITDVGMTGPYDSVIGVQTDIVLDQVIKNMNVHHEVAKGDPRVCAVLVELDEETGRARSIEQIQHPQWRTKL